MMLNMMKMMNLRITTSSTPTDFMMTSLMMVNFTTRKSGLKMRRWRRRSRISDN